MERIAAARRKEVDFTLGETFVWVPCRAATLPSSPLLLLWLSIPSGFLVVFEKPNRSSFTFTFTFTIVHTPCSMGMSHMAEYTCCSSVAFERPNENTFTFTLHYSASPLPVCNAAYAAQCGRFLRCTSCPFSVSLSRLACPLSSLPPPLAPPPTPPCIHMCCNRRDDSFARSISVLIIFPSLAAVVAFVVRVALGYTLSASDGACRTAM
jgi:hypothetical protein